MTVLRLEKTTLVGRIIHVQGPEFEFFDGTMWHALPYNEVVINGLRHDAYVAIDVVEIEISRNLAIEKGLLMTQGKE